MSEDRVLYGKKRLLNDDERGLIVEARIVAGKIIITYVKKPGAWTGFDAISARKFAASLIACADELDAKEEQWTHLKS